MIALIYFPIYSLWRMIAMTTTTRKNSPPPIVFILAGAVCIAGSYALLAKVQSGESALQSSSIQDRVSVGGKLLIAADVTAEKKKGVLAYAQDDFNQAIASFESSLRQSPNDPESLIYLNNAKSMNQNTLKIVVSVPVGSDLNASKEILRGVAQSQHEFNEMAGVASKKLIVEIANDDNDPHIAQQLAQSFVDQPKILGVVGHYASSVTLATTPIYDKGQLTSISPISSAVQLSNKSRFVLRTVPSDSTAAKSLADYMLGQLHKTKAVVYFNSKSDYSKSLKEEFSKVIVLQGGHLVTEYDLADSTLSARDSLQKAQQQGAEVIMLAANTGTLDKALQVVQSNPKHLPILGGDDVYTPKTLDVCREKGIGMVIAIPWHSLASSSIPFATRARHLWSAEVNWRTVTAYDATQSLVAAFQKLSNPDRSSVSAELASPNFMAQGASSPIRFLPSGDRISPIQLVTIAKGSQSGFGFGFIPIKP
jgi:branched-chain amino acid transport system substrate-binding protein